MKPKLTQSIFLSVMLFIGSVLVLSSCSPTDDIKPITGAPTNTVTIKIRDMGSSIINQQPKHLVISSSFESGQVLLDTTITGNFTYNFNTTKASMYVKATLTSSNQFLSSLEIDANGKMQAYHDGSCTVSEFDLSDNLSFY
jgi:hypothetical protein